MMQNSTKLNLISYLYGELSIEDSIDTTNQILGNKATYTEFKELVKVKEDLSQIALVPKQRVIDAILEASVTI